MKKGSIINWKLYLLLLAVSIISVILVLPYSIEGISSLLEDVEMPMAIVLTISVIQSAIMLAIALFLGLFLSKKTGIGAPVLENYISGIGEIKNKKSFFLLAIISGIIIGLILIAGDYIFYKTGTSITFFNAVQPVWWKGLMASFYGGIVEEILMRLFLMNLFVWIFSMIIKKGGIRQNRPLIWLSIILAAIIFGAGHLPATSAIAPLTPIVVLRALLLNGIGGIVFGWLFWKRGLLSAMVSHFSADIILHVLFPIIIFQVNF